MQSFEKILHTSCYSDVQFILVAFKFLVEFSLDSMTPNMYTIILARKIFLLRMEASA